MSGTMSTRWFWSDWMSDPSLRACGYAARGLWKDLLCIAGSNKHDYGYVSLNGRKLENADIARMTNGTPEEVAPLLAELERNGVFSRNRQGTIYCRRMVRVEKNRKNGRLGGNPNLMKSKQNEDSLNREPKALIPEPDPKPKKKKTPAPAAPSDWPEDYQDRFWSLFPRKTDKLGAFKKLDAIRKGGKVPWAVMVSGLLRYSAAVVGWEQRFMKPPDRWLTNGCWMDEYKPEGGKKDGKDQRGPNSYGELSAHLRARAAERESAGSVPAANGPGDSEPTLDLVATPRR